MRRIARQRSCPQSLQSDQLQVIEIRLFFRFDSYTLTTVLAFSPETPVFFLANSKFLRSKTDLLREVPTDLLNPIGQSQLSHINCIESICPPHIQQCMTFTFHRFIPEICISNAIVMFVRKCFYNYQLNFRISEYYAVTSLRLDSAHTASVPILAISFKRRTGLVLGQHYCMVCRPVL